MIQKRAPASFRFGKREKEWNIMQHDLRSFNNVRRLQIREAPFVETEKLNSLQNALGREPSRDIVERAAYELSDRLHRLEVALYNGDLVQTAKLSSGLIGISEQIGLCTFARIAKDLVDAINHTDIVAIAAISNRLIRHGEESLFKVVDYADNPICS
jgi:hypothetical protein